MRRLITLIALALFASVGAQAQSTPVPGTPTVATSIVIGEAHVVTSRVLGDRTINVYLPADYATSGQRYPVLYLIDGGLAQDFLHVAGTSHLGALWDRSRAVIVVGVETRDRRAELTGPTRDPDLLKRYPTAGGSGAFRTFLRTEVKPLIAARYRVSQDDAVMGESLAGLFVVETLLREPTLFKAYAAISPSLWWDKQRLASEVAPDAREGLRLYLAIANEGGEQEATTRRIAGLLATVPTGCFVARPDLTHATIYHSLAPDALQFLFPPAAPPAAETGFVHRCASRVSARPTGEETR